MLFYIKKFFSYISLFFLRGALSDKDIINLLGNHIFIYPFDPKNLKASSYNLTASKCAFIIEDKKQKLIVRDDNIIIPAGKTGIIETQESIYVSKRITGTYHSRVKLVNMGLGHIGTTLDPCFFGVSAIALHNTTKEDIAIKVGDSIASIMFYTLKSKSTGLHDNMTGHVNDGIKFDINDFYEVSNNKKKTITMVFKEDVDVSKKIRLLFFMRKAKIINNNQDIRNKAFILYDVDKPSCDKCISCSNNETCAYKLLKNINDEQERRNRVVEDLKKWKSNDYIVSKECLIKRVREYIKIKNTDTDILLWGVFWVVVGVGVLTGILYYINKYPNNIEINSALRSIVATIMPTVSIVIGMIYNYKKKHKGEEK